MLTSCFLKTENNIISNYLNTKVCEQKLSFIQFDLKILQFETTRPENSNPSVKAQKCMFLSQKTTYNL